MVIARNLFARNGTLPTFLIGIHTHMSSDPEQISYIISREKGIDSRLLPKTSLPQALIRNTMFCNFLLSNGYTCGTNGWDDGVNIVVVETDFVPVIDDLTQSRIPEE